MKLLIAQRIFSWTDSFDVLDEFQEVQFTVKAELLSIGHKLRVYDRNHELVGSVVEKCFNLLPKFEIEISGQKVATLNRLLSLFRPKYELNCGDWAIEGDFMGWEYSIVESGMKIIQISKQVFSWSDVYEIDIENKKDALMGLMVVLAIDAANCSKSRGN